MVRGRKKRHYNPARKTLYISDLEAYEICKRKGVNLSKELSMYIRFLSGGSGLSLDQKADWLLKKIKILQDLREQDLKDIQNKYKAIILSKTEQLDKINKAIAARDLKEATNKE